MSSFVLSNTRLPHNPTLRVLSYNILPGKLMWLSMFMFILDGKVLLRVVLEIAEKEKNLFPISLNRYYYTRWWLKREKGCLFWEIQ